MADRVIVPEIALSLAGLELRLYLSLCSRADTNGVLRAHQSELRAVLGCSRRTLADAVRGLVSSGAVKVDHAVNSASKSRFFVVDLPGQKIAPVEEIAGAENCPTKSLPGQKIAPPNAEQSPGQSIRRGNLATQEEPPPGQKIAPPTIKSSEKSKKKNDLRLVLPIDIKLSKLLHNYLLLDDPNTKPIVLEKWAEHIEKLRRIDKRDPQEIREVIVWCHEVSDFWPANIRSTAKLRAKYPQLRSQMQRGANGGRRKNLGEVSQVAEPGKYDHLS